ncbi:MAG: hypothetical protein ACO1OG_09145 [Devosia sp.]
MFRLATSMFALTAAAALGAPAIAADWGESPADIYREGYSMEPYEWSELGDQEDGIHIETGLRYWYSWGAQSYGLEDFGDYDTEDNASTIELQLRVEDDATSTYAKGWLGYSAAISGSYSIPNPSDPGLPSVTGDIIDGKIGYGGADFGWNAISDGQGNGIGAFVGYNYWENSPRTERTGYAVLDGDIPYDPETGTWSVGGDSQDDVIQAQMLRLGISGKAEINDFFDISGELAAVPFATVTGVIGGNALGDSPGQYPGCADPDPALCAPYFFKTSPTNIDGWGYGGMAELMAGIHPTENITFRFGGRAWYLQGTYDATFTGAEVTPPIFLDPANPPPAPQYSPPSVAAEDYIITENPFSMLRYGIVTELTYRF